MAPEPSSDEEIRRFEEQYRSNPDGLVFARLADAYRKEGDPDRALSLLRDGIARHPDYPSAHIVRARALVDLDRPAEAEASLRRVLELDPRNLVAMRGLSGLAERRGDPVEAVHWYEQIATLDPMNVEAEAALERLRADLPPTTPGLEPLPAPREEWWSSPAFEVAGADTGTGTAAENPPDVRSESGGRDDAVGESPADEPTTAQWEIGEPETGAGEETGEAAPPAPPALAVPSDSSAPGGSSAGAASPGASSAWWFEDPGDEEPDEDGDLLTRTMAELYVKQGLVDEAIAIYRELLEDHPEDPELTRALSALQRPVAEPESEPRPDEDPKLAAGAWAEADSAARPELGPASERIVPPDGTDASGPADVAAAARPDGTGPSSTPTPIGDPYATHPVPLVAAASERYRDWIRRLEE